MPPTHAPVDTDRAWRETIMRITGEFFESARRTFGETAFVADGDAANDIRSLQEERRIAEADRNDPLHFNKSWCIQLMLEDVFADWLFSTQDQGKLIACFQQSKTFAGLNDSLRRQVLETFRAYDALALHDLACTYRP